MKGERRVVIYTAIADGYDLLHVPERPWKHVSYVAFVDNPKRGRGRIGPWELRPHPYTLATPRRTAKYPKVMAHAVFPQATHSLWMDGHISAVPGIRLGDLLEQFLTGADFAMLHHPDRDCLYEEALTCMAARLDDPDVIFRQVAGYAQEGFPAHLGLGEACVILRRHTARIRRLNTAWWSEIERGSQRDQVSFAYVAWKLGVSFNRMPAVNREGALFNGKAHQKRGRVWKPPKPPVIATAEQDASPPPPSPPSTDPLQ